ncbi:MAG: 1-acyl-sn-glycerol-3-phosphate acyltransferase [Deltaproteobacteria bacterium]|nr:MAG: 1-acyl-sn-glycerol-3-phosphate acyltransferase [Deltaproteobacteria bacterium]
MLAWATDNGARRRAREECGLRVLRYLRWFANSLFCYLWTFINSFIATLALCLGHQGRASHWVGRRSWAAGMLRFCGIKATASGLDNFDPRRPYVFVANHQSLFDIPAVFYTNPANLRFIAKKSLFYIPFFGSYLALAGYIALDRSNRRKAIASHDRAAEKIRHGVPIISFPEGTRSADGEVRKFKKGAFMLAIKAGVPIVPVSISGTREVLPKHSLLVRSGRIRIHYDRPVETSDYGVEGRDTLMEKVRQTVLANKRLLDAGRIPDGGQRQE